MPCPQHPTTYEYQPCRTGAIIRLVLVYRLARLTHPVGVGELPGFRGLLRAYALHHLWWLHRTAHFLRRARGRLARLRRPR
jgi:hypothetical protein